MKRALAIILTAFILLQALPAGAETYSEWISVIPGQTETAQYHTVRFFADGEEISSVQIVDGSNIDYLPSAPVKASMSFIGWYAGGEALDSSSVITSDMTAYAVYAETDASVETQKQSADFLYTDKGAFANVTIFGTHKKNQAPTASRSSNVSGAGVLEAWVAGNVKNNTSLTVEAIITALPEEGSLSAYTVVSGKLGSKVASGLNLGDRVVFALSMKGATGLALVNEAEADGSSSETEGALYANKYFYLTGKIPGNGIIDVTPVTVEIEGKQALAAFDIKIYTNANQQRKGNTWQPAGKKVKVHWYDASFENREVNVYHYKDGATTPTLEGSVTAKDGWVEFDAGSFSVYAIVDGSQTTPETYSVKYEFKNTDDTDYMFVNEDGNTVNYQYVKNGEAPFNVGTPSGNQQEGYEFVGWYTKDGSEWSELVIDAEGHGNPVTGLTSNGTVKQVYPRYDRAYYVYYYDESATGADNEQIYMIDVIYENEINTGAYSTLSGGKPKIDYIPNTSTKAFLGWSTTPGQTSESSIITSVNIPDEGVIKLYPVTAQVYWISFDKNDWDYAAESDPAKAEWKLENGTWVNVGPGNGGTHTRKGTGALYVAPIFTLTGEKISDRYSSIPTTTRPGYSFAGWYLPDGTLLQPYYQPTQDVTVTAHWTASNSQSYNVVFWRQNATDEVDANPKTYSYDHTDTRYAATGSTVSISAADRSGAGTGFNFNESASTDSATVAADGSTVLNVYYDRNVYSVTFEVDGYGIRYVPTSANTGTQYGFVNGEYVQLQRTPVEYFLSFYQNSTDRYTGTVYSINGNSVGNVITNPVYPNSYAGQYNGSYYKLYWNTRYEWIYNGSIYTATRFTRQTSNNYHTVKTVQALYEHSIKDHFPVIGNDGTNYSGYYWDDSSTTKIYDYILQTIETMPAANVVFRGTNSGTVELIRYYVEIIPGVDEAEVSFNGKQYKLYKDVEHYFRYLTFNEEYHPIEGYTRDRSWANPAFGTNNQASLGAAGTVNGKSYDAINYLYYNRELSNLEFWDSFDKTQFGSSIPVPYETPLATYESQVTVSSDKTTLTYGSAALSHEGYVFKGWYADPECTTPFDFSASMPNNAVQIYAGWTKLRYRVWIQPNGGQLSASESTYFRADWGELIQEYTDVPSSRNYVEDENGEYSYVYIADVSNEARVAYYKKTSELTTVTLYNDDGTVKATYNETAHTDGKKYSYMPGVYTFVGWYRVNGTIDENTPPSLGRDADTVWNFNNPVTENVAIKALWKRVGTFTIRYSDTSLTGIKGTLGDNIQDQNVYFDLAQAVTEVAPTPPYGYVFMGWRTPDGEIHQPGDLFAIKSDYAEAISGQTDSYAYTLTPVFEQISNTSITYNLNWSDNATVTGAWLEYSEAGYGSQPDNSHIVRDNNSLQNLIANGKVVLSAGKGFGVSGYKQIGWSDVAIDPASNPIKLVDGSFSGSIPSGATLFKLGGTYGVSDGSNTLYAVWEKVPDPTLYFVTLPDGSTVKQLTNFRDWTYPVVVTVMNIGGVSPAQGMTLPNVALGYSVHSISAPDMGYYGLFYQVPKVMDSSDYPDDQTKYQSMKFVNMGIATLTDGELTYPSMQNTVLYLKWSTERLSYQYSADNTNWTDFDENTVVYAIYSDSLTLTLTKEVTGGFGDRNKTFGVTVTVQPAGQYKYKLNNGTTQTIPANGSIDIKHGDTLTLLELPVNAAVTLTENDNSGGIYTKTWTKNNGDGDNADGDTLSVMLTQNTMYTLTNNLEPVAPTDYRSNALPFALMLLAGVALIAIGRRKRQIGGGDRND